MGRSSSKQGSKLGGVEVEKIEKSSRREENHLSGAYIRSLVKQLTSSRNKEPLNTMTTTHPTENGADGHGCPSQIPAKPGQPQTQPHKKQVRRRLHTSRPYQERLLNMAEARREIVAALKFHRASMKQQANEQQQSLQPPPQSQPSNFDESRRNSSMMYPSNPSNYSNYLDNVSSYNNTQNPYSYAPQSVAENYNFTLPNQALGLNLNIHDFNNIDTTVFNNNYNNCYHHPSFSPSSSSSPSLFVSTMEEAIPNFVTGTQEGSSMVDMNEGGGGGLHAVMDDEEMAEIRSMGEIHDVEWNDRMNLVKSAWWFKFTNTMEISSEDLKTEDDGFSSPFDQVMEFPSWLSNGNEEYCLQQQFSDDPCSDDYFLDLSLPCMDIEEIEGMDGEWLA